MKFKIAILSLCATLTVMFLLIALRDKSYLYYILFILSFIAYEMSVNGFTYLYLLSLVIC